MAEQAIMEIAPEIPIRWIDRSEEVKKCGDVSLICC
jgi:hypothetical protein